MPFPPRRPFLVTCLLSAAWAAAAAGAPRDLAEITLSGATADLVASDGLHLRISFLADDMFRVQAAAAGDFPDAGNGTAPIVLPQEEEDVVVTAVADGTGHLLSTPQIQLRVRAAPLRLELRRAGDGALLWRELKALSLGDSTTAQTLDSDPGEQFFGGGQQNGAVAFKGRLMEISYSGGWEEGDRPSPAPFYMSTRGYGVLRNTWADGTYDFRSDDYLTTAHAEARFDAYYLVADDFQGVLDLYTQLTGRAPLLARWAFGYGDADCYNDGDNVDKPGTVPDGWSDGPTGTTLDVVASVAEKYREHDMPGGWILPNDGYGCGYADLPEVVSRLADLGFRTGLWTEDGVEKIAWEIGTAGTRVQKLDVAWTGKGYQWALDANHDAALGFLDNSDARPFIWTVMGWAGIQRYAVTWTGDQSGSWDYIRWHVPTLVGSGLSGMNYSTGDVDGIFGGSPETFTRDLQWKSFTSVFMGMSGWSKAERKHPWWFDEPYRSINRRYLKLRQRLMPYIYTLARETETTGAPMVRGVMWDHPDDPAADDHPDQFFLGRDLLVAPVYRSQAASGGWREGVYLPAGTWIDYWDGTVTEGPGTVDIPVDLATLPVLVRAGAILPMYPESLYDGQVAADPLTLDIYPAGESAFTLYEDDGNTRAYRDGAFSTQRFAVDADLDRIDIHIGPAEGDFAGRLTERGFDFQVHTRTRPHFVQFAAADLPRFGEAESLAAAAAGWFFDPDDRGGVVHLKAGRLDTRAAHQLSLFFAAKAVRAAAGGYQVKPPSDGTIGPDDLMVVARPAEEPGHPLENAFDGNPDTWFRTVRDQSVAYGPHEFTLAVGGRRVIAGFRIRPRNDKYWQYGQVRHYEIHLADVNGRWGEPVAAGELARTEDAQEVRFPAAAGRLLRFRILSTHDDGADPMVTGAAGQGERPWAATAPVRVGSATISEFRLLEQAVPDGPAATVSLPALAAGEPSAVHLDGLDFPDGLALTGNTRTDFALEGAWLTLQAEAGTEGPGTVRFQVWGDGQLLWDSGAVAPGTIVKPRLDIRGLTRLSLRTVAGDPGQPAVWAQARITGAGDATARPEGR